MPNLLRRRRSVGDRIYITALSTASRLRRNTRAGRNHAGEVA